MLLLAVGLAASAATPSTLSYEARLTGVATAKDGDDVAFGKFRVRLQGIAAPEHRRNKKEPGGRSALENLRSIVDGKEIECLLDGELASQNRPSGICYLNGVDIGQLQVEAGHARDCPRYSERRYAEFEARARASGHNLEAVYALPEYCYPKGDFLPAAGGRDPAP